jgi:hypothetical protein
MKRRIINIDPLFECRTQREFNHRMDEGLFSHLLTGVIGFLIGKHTGIKIAGRRDNVERFKKAMTNMKMSMQRDVWKDTPPEEMKRLLKKYDLTIAKA